MDEIYVISRSRSFLDLEIRDLDLVLFWYIKFMLDFFVTVGAIYFPAQTIQMWP